VQKGRLEKKQLGGIRTNGAEKGGKKRLGEGKRRQVFKGCPTPHCPGTRKCKCHEDGYGMRSDEFAWVPRCTLWARREGENEALLIVRNLKSSPEFVRDPSFCWLL
jgi:hypothetical protein